jgi:hypothetical protein
VGVAPDGLPPVTSPGLSGAGLLGETGLPPVVFAGEGPLGEPLVLLGGGKSTVTFSVGAILIPLSASHQSSCFGVSGTDDGETVVVGAGLPSLAGFGGSLGFRAVTVFTGVLTTGVGDGSPLPGFVVGLTGSPPLGMRGASRPGEAGLTVGFTSLVVFAVAPPLTAPSFGGLVGGPSGVLPVPPLTGDGDTGLLVDAPPLFVLVGGLPLGVGLDVFGVGVGVTGEEVLGVAVPLAASTLSTIFLSLVRLSEASTVFFDWAWPMKTRLSPFSSSISF